MVELNKVHPIVITGGVFVVYGAHVKKVVNRGPVTTYGVNDMVLDNWGIVNEWVARRTNNFSWTKWYWFCKL